MKLKIKKWDIIIIILLLIISFLPYLCIKEFKQVSDKGIYAYVTVAGKPYKQIPLTGQVNYKEIVIETEYGKNILGIQNESIAVVEADCTDHICKEFGYKDKPGDIIVCLPNKLYIEIKGNDSNQEEDARGY